jgi:protocatechuate 3,4-dioxygenase beta subunit
MEQDDAMIGTILSRREALRMGMGVALSGALAVNANAVFQSAVHKEVQLTATPALTEGPFFVDEKLTRSNLIGDSKRLSVVNGIPLSLTIRLYHLVDGRYLPCQGAVVDLWHADAAGVYSDESNPMNHEDTGGQKWLRGNQISDGSGVTSFQTIVPGWYPGRTPHIHFKIRTGAPEGPIKDFTSQLFFDDAVTDKLFAHPPYAMREGDESRNRSDGIYMDRQVDGSVAGDHLKLELVADSATKGYKAKFVVAVV